MESLVHRPTFGEILEQMPNAKEYSAKELGMLRFAELVGAAGIRRQVRERYRAEEDPAVDMAWQRQQHIERGGDPDEFVDGYLKEGELVQLSA